MAKGARWRFAPALLRRWHGQYRQQRRRQVPGALSHFVVGPEPVPASL